jgi:GT2 family glycosyltransferase
MISVLMPVYNGERTLDACLDGWLAQSGASIELIAVDNGSTDGSRDTLAQRARLDSRLNVLDEAPGSQSRASNRALAEAKGELLIWTAQDMLVGPDFAAGHLEAHQASARPGEALAVLGHIRYPESALVTPFMRCLVKESAFQFNFAAITNPEEVDPLCLYAPNFSISRRVMLKLGGFDEAFPYGWQDADLGVRLLKLGGRIVYRPLLESLHDHPVEGRAYLKRMEQVGRDCPLFMAKHPGVLNPADFERARRVHFIEGRRMASAAQKLIRLAEEHPDAQLPQLDAGDGKTRDAQSAAWVLLMKYHLYKGFHDALKASGQLP